jgi:hypothetical protein
MGKPKTIEERVGILEQGKTDCQELQLERYEGMDKRMANIEAWKDRVVLLIIVTLLGVLGNLALAVVGFLAKR